MSITPASGSTGQGKNSAVVLTLSREKITKDETTNLLVEADGASVPLEVNVLFGDKEEGGEGGGEGGSDKKGSCKEITSCDSEVKIEFLSCLKNVDTVEFQFTMTNNREDWRVWFNRDKSGSLDDKGNSYSGSYTKVYVGDSNTFVTGGSSVSFLKGAKVKCRVVIPGIKDEAVYLQRWEWIISSSEPWNPQTKKVMFAEVKW
ncbi:hypothetical protein [Bacteroides helcogenes]|uniref:hypothetical protein n=1 Tax=Bacteroides helcogenes TaxID=290053 RepID=UPI0016519F20|nr:hypothetical protein [Bacteroides helcogenes]MDY5239488.1 hypothetical protein [Bacteroides helcogenes]